MSSNSNGIEQPEPPPRVFIGSSSEALKIAHDIGEELKKGGEIDVKVWDQDVLQPGDVLLDGLLRFVTVFDFVILVLSPDDMIVSKKQKRGAPRDNVIFELGMFMGVLGRRRSFPIITLGKEGTPKLPSDLDGMLYTRLDLKNLSDRTYLAREVSKIREQIKQRSKEAPLSLLPSTGLAYGYFHNFLIPVHKILSALQSINLFDKEVDMTNGNYDFTILFPQLASEASIEHRTDYVRKFALKSVTVKTKDESSRERSYAFFVYPTMDGGKVHFADYPTTLRSSYETINLVLKPGALGELADEKEQLEKKEVTNFIKALKHLLKEPVAGKLSEKLIFRPI
jgi:hypothetical protein